MQPVFAPLLYGKEKDIFEDAGFDIDVTSTQGGEQR
jgi:hypothetical protein